MIQRMATGAEPSSSAAQALLAESLAHKGVSVYPSNASQAVAVQDGKTFVP